MKAKCFNYIGFSLLCTTLLVGIAAEAFAQVNLNVNIGPPPIVEPNPAEIVVIPQTDIVFVPNTSFDVLFTDGFWWSLRGGERWYRSRQYKGNWSLVQRNTVPEKVLNLPQNYKELYKNGHHLNCDEWKKSKISDAHVQK